MSHAQKLQLEVGTGFGLSSRTQVRIAATYAHPIPLFANLQMELTEKFQLVAGLTLETNGYDYYPGEAAYDIEHNQLGEADSKVRVQFLFLPIGLKYYIGVFYIKPSIRPGILLSAKKKWQADLFPPDAKTEEPLEANNAIHLSAALDLGVESPLHKDKPEGTKFSIAISVSDVFASTYSYPESNPFQPVFPVRLPFEQGFLQLSLRVGLLFGSGQ